MHRYSNHAFCLLAILFVHGNVSAGGGFEPAGGRTILRQFGMHFGQGYHAVPCRDHLKEHYNRSVAGVTHHAHRLTPVYHFNQQTRLVDMGRYDQRLPYFKGNSMPPVTQPVWLPTARAYVVPDPRTGRYILDRPQGMDGQFGNTQASDPDGLEQRPVTPFGPSTSDAEDGAEDGAEEEDEFQMHDDKPVITPKIERLPKFDAEPYDPSAGAWVDPDESQQAKYKEADSEDASEIEFVDDPSFDEETGLYRDVAPEKDGDSTLDDLGFDDPRQGNSPLHTS